MYYAICNRCGGVAWTYPARSPMPSRAADRVDRNGVPRHGIHIALNPHTGKHVPTSGEGKSEAAQCSACGKWITSSLYGQLRYVRADHIGIRANKDLQFEAVRKRFNVLLEACGRMRWLIEEVAHNGEGGLGATTVARARWLIKTIGELEEGAVSEGGPEPKEAGV